MGRLILELLGVPSIHSGDHAITFPTRKALALLAYLAVERGTQPRERITALLWPDSSAERGRASLRKTLAYLRQALRDAGPPDGGVPYLVADRDSLLLNPAAEIRADVWLLQSAAEAMRRAPLASPGALVAAPSAYLQRVLEPLQQAAACYRGDFLAGFSLSDSPEFDDWASVSREMFHRQAALVFDRLSEIQFETGDLANALDTARRWVTRDGLNEAAHYRLIQVLVAGGDRGGALLAYEACRTTLERELGIEPSAEIAALAQRIKIGRAGARGPSTRPGRQPGARGRSPFLSVSPLVGRAFEHVQLVSGYRAVLVQGPQAIALEGEPGIGKTRLAHDFLAWAAAQGARIGEGRALETGGHLLYHPLVEVLRAALADWFPPPVAPGRGRDLPVSRVWLAELGRLLPELTEYVPDLPAPLPVSEAESRLRLLESVARLGQALAGDRPLVLFIDDVHWADTASLEVLQYVARQWATAGLPVLLVFALRTEELAANPALADWLHVLRRELPVTRLTLSALTLDDTRRLVQAMTANEPDPPREPPGTLETFCRQLFAETGGHPFFIVQTLCSLAERGLLARDGQGEWQARLDLEIPGSVRDLIRERLARLSPSAQLCCIGGATLGDGFQFSTLCQVIGLDEPEALRALDELLARGLWHEEHTEQGGPVYVFAHDRIREVAYEQSSETRRRRLHQRALEVMRPAGAPAAELARHAHFAGLPALAFRLRVEAGIASMSLFAIRDAIDHFEQALRLWQSGGLGSDDALRHSATRLHQYLGRAYELTNQHERAHAIYAALLASARGAHDPVVECLALNRLAILHVQRYSETETPLARLREALQVAGASGDTAGLAETEWNLAQLHFYRADVAAGQPHAARALRLARELGQDELIARTLNVLAYLEGRPGGWAVSETYAAEARALYAALNDRAMEVDCLALIARARFGRGQARAGVAAAEAALLIAREIENPWGLTNAHLQLSIGLLETGDYSAALEHALHATSLGRTHQLSTLLCAVHIMLGNVYRALGEFDGARQAHLDAKRYNEMMSSRPFTTPVAAALCADYAAEGAWEEAHAWARQAQAARESSLDFNAEWTFWCEVGALLWAGELPPALEAVRRLGERIGDDRRYRIPYLRSLAALARGEGATEQAAAHLEAALAVAGDLGLPGEEWPILKQLAELYAANGEAARARAARERASAIGERLARTIAGDESRQRFLRSVRR